jgi:CDP-diacylglycerol---glycerol-3-phosphate 3-phosphatidyltransferase
MTIATYLTLIRIGLIPIFIIVFYLPFKWVHLASAIIFSLAALTDWLDGYLARRFDQVSTFGAFLDPVADKLMVAVALVLLVQVHHSPWLAIPAAVIVGREIAVSALREWMAEIGKSSKVAVSMIGKIKTGSQMAAIIMLLYYQPIGIIPIDKLGFIALYVAAVLTLWSMIRYLAKAWPSLNDRYDE